MWLSIRPEEASFPQIDTFGILSRGLQDLSQIADSHDLVPADGDSLGIRVVRDAGEDLGVKQDAFGFVAALSPRDGGRAVEHNCYKKTATPAASPHSILRCSQFRL